MNNNARYFKRKVYFYCAHQFNWLNRVESLIFGLFADSLTSWLQNAVGIAMLHNVSTLKGVLIHLKFFSLSYVNTFVFIFINVAAFHSLPVRDFHKFNWTHLPIAWGFYSVREITLHAFQLCCAKFYVQYFLQFIL